jgi:hypothetical protein
MVIAIRVRSGKGLKVFADARLSFPYIMRAHDGVLYG